MEFTERTPLEQGFAPIFKADVLPVLQEFEFERKAMRRRSMRNMALVALGTIAVLIAVFLIWGQDVALRLSPVAVIMGGVFAWSEWSASGGRFKAKLTDGVMPVVCGHIGDLTYSASGGNFSLSAMREMRLLPEYDNAARTSLLRGTHDGTQYSIVQAALTVTYHNHDNRRRTETVFKGLLFKIRLAEPAPGRITLLRDRGGIGNKVAETFSFGSTRSQPRVNFDDAAFEQAFATYATRPEEARDFLSAARRAALVQIGADHGRLLAGFDGSDFYMALERSAGFIEMGSLDVPASDLEACLHGVFRDIEMSQRVIERLNVA